MKKYPLITLFLFCFLFASAQNGRRIMVRQNYPIANGKSLDSLDQYGLTESP